MRYLTLLLFVFAILAPLKTIAQNANNSAFIGNPASPSTTEDLEQRGKQLRGELEQKINEWKPADSFVRLNVTSIFLKYIPVGISFKEAEKILKAAEFNLAATPPRPPRADQPSYDRFNLRGGFYVYGYLSNRECAFQIVPEKPGDPNTTVKKVSAAVFQNYL